MESSIKDDILEYFVREMRERLGAHLKQLILFGSRARGDETAEFDYDFLVVVNEVSRKKEGLNWDVPLFLYTDARFVFATCKKFFREWEV